MADAFDTPFTSDPQQEQTAPAPQAAAPERDEDAPFGLFEVGENVNMLRSWHELDVSFSGDVGDKMHFAHQMGTNLCTSLDGIATKIEYVLGNRIADFELSERGELAEGWRLVEIMALTTSIIDLHRIRRLGAEDQP